MAGELKHKTVGTELTQAEYEHIEAHQFDGQTTDDLVYASSATQLSRLAMAASRIPAKLAAGGLVAATVAEIKTLLNWAADIATHAGLTTGTHGVGGNHVAATHTAGQVVSNLVWKDASALVMTDLNRTTTLNWTDLDLTASTSANAKIAILLLDTVVDSITAGAGNICYFVVRKNGTTPAAEPGIIIDGASYAAGSTPRTVVILGMDAGQVIEYALVIGGTIQIDSYLSVIGYVE